MIKPTIGRVVLFHPFPGSDLDQITPRPPHMAALVAYVWSDSMVNLTVFDANGTPHGVTSVELVQDGEDSRGGHWCEWMPYQKGQAAKYEALEKQVGAGG